MREKIVTTLLERVLDIADGNSVSVSREKDENGDTVVVITVKVDN